MSGSMCAVRVNISQYSKTSPKTPSSKVPNMAKYSPISILKESLFAQGPGATKYSGVSPTAAAPIRNIMSLVK